MDPFLWSLLLSFQALPLSSAQSYTPLPQSSCLNPAAITATGYGKCESVVSEFAKCNSTARTEKAAAATCICRQEMLNGIFDCENESRFCGGMNSGPYLFDLADSWHSACNSRITFTPTTPALSTYSSIDIDACSSAWDGCISQSAEASKCLGYTTKESELQSCMCQPQMLSAAFTCNYYANVSCELTPGTLSEVLGYSYCSNFMGSIGYTNRIPPSSIYSLC